MPHPAESSRCRIAFTVASSENHCSPSSDATKPDGLVFVDNQPQVEVAKR